MNFHIFLDHAFSYPYDGRLSPCQAWCAMCGEQIIEGYELNLKSATAEVSDSTRYGQKGENGCFEYAYYAGR